VLSILFAVLGLVVAGLVLWLGEDGSPSQSATTQGMQDEGAAPSEAPRLLGVKLDDARRTDGAPAPFKQPEKEAHSASTLHGLVTDEHDAPIAGATVFVLPKNIPGYRDAPAGATTLPLVRTDGDGRWTMAARDVSNSWIGALADGHEAAHVDGDNMPEGAVHLRLERCRAIAVVVEGMNGPPPQGTRVSAQSVGERYALPGPGAARRFYVAGEVDPSVGVVSLHPPLREQVEIRASRFGFFAEPERVVLRAHVPRVTFRLLPSCVLILRVSDAATGKPLSQGFNFSVERSGKAVQGGATTLAGGEFRLADRLRPGRHTIVVSSDGYSVSRHEGVVFRRPGGEVTIASALKRDPTLGRLRVRVPILADLPTVRHPLSGELQPAPAFFLMRRVAPSAGGWSLSPSVEREDATTYSFSHLPPGEVDVFVGNYESKRVAILRSVAIPKGSTNIVTAELTPGGMLDVASGPGDRVVAIRSDHDGSLPVYAKGMGWMSVYGPEDTIDPDMRLGPYPLGPASLKTLTKQGEAREQSLDIGVK